MDGRAAGGSRRDPEEHVELAWLVHKAGRKRARALLSQTGSARAALADLAQARGEFEDFACTLERAGDRLLVQDDPEFPPLLREIPDPPLVLYVAGDPRALGGPAVAVVGARRCSRSGAANATAFARDLAALGFVVVSGLALGIDAAAHRGALQTGRTAAVMGSGLATIYPRTHAALAAAILDSGGVLLSEYPPAHAARSYHFPERNRLISGLALGVLVVEAGEQSGSLITARLALEQGRDVLAIPGSIGNPVARGCHRLLRQGAALVETVADIVEALGVPPPAGVWISSDAARSPEPADAALAALLGLVGMESTTLDALCAGAGMSAEDIVGRLLQLELGGFVEQVPGGYIRRGSGPG